jgi:MFS family permease
MEDYTTQSESKRLAELPERKRVRSLRFSVWDAVFYAAMVGLAETYFVPLMLAIGASNFQIGFFTAAPQFFVAFAQFASILLVERLRVRKRLLVSVTAAQAAMLATILAMLLMRNLTPLVFTLLAIGYFASNGMAVPAWNSLMGDLTTTADRGAYFGRRSGLSQLIIFFGIVAGGLILQRFENSGIALKGFAVVLALALAGRLASIFALSHHFEVPYKKTKDADFSFLQFLKRSPKSNFAHFVFFVALMNFAVQMASPYFAVYMIRDLKFSYVQYMIAQGIFVATQFIAMRRWGPFADKYGNRLVLRITGSITPVIPLLWFLSRHFSYIILVQIVAGLAWAGWTLASTNFIFDAVTPPKRARCAAYMNFFNGMGFFLGAITGAILSARAPAAFNTGALTFTFYSPLLTIFLISAALRFVIVFLFMPTVREVRTVSEPRVKDMFVMLTHVKPLSGVRYEPYTGVDKSHKENGNGENGAAAPPESN